MEKIYEYPDGSKRITQYATPVTRGSGSAKVPDTTGRSDKTSAEEKEENDRQYLFKVKRRIKEYEKEQHRNDIEKQKDYDDKGWGKINPSEKTFTALFGPIVKTSRYGLSTKKVRGCQWDKITDDNVTYYEGGYDSALHKKIKQLYASKIRGLLVVCDPETHDIVYAVRGYSDNDDKTGKPKKPSTFEFKA